LADDSRAPIIASIAANIAIAATKFTAAAITGSSALLAEGVHSLVDSSDGVLLLVGQRRSRRPADVAHPVGYGRELYFWSLMVAVLFFGLGGGVSVYKGIQHILNPPPIHDPTWNYIVLGAAALLDGTSFVIGFRRFRRQAGHRTLWQQVRRSKDPALFTVVLEDTADLVGIALAFLGVYFSHRFARPYLDGAASIAVGLVLAGVALVLIIETKSLLLGESADSEVVATIREAVAGEPLITAMQSPITVYLGPREIFVAIAVEFAPTLQAEELARIIERAEANIRSAVPEVKHIYIEAASLRGR
jgi:cation diffusion facilitator family transporter